MAHVDNPSSKKRVTTNFIRDEAGNCESKTKKRNGMGGIDVASLAEFLAKLEAAGLIHVNRRKLKLV